MYLPPSTIIASGPVIIEDDKVLLNREKKENGETLFMFPGGMVEDFSLPFEEICRREAKEEMGIDLEIIKPLRTLIVKRPDAKNTLAILIHFLAKRIGDINPGEKTIEWGWYDIHSLPENCAPNVIEIMQDYLYEKKNDF